MKNILQFNSPSFEELSSKEWLITNGIGGYASSSLSGANTRRYHGLLVASLNPPTDRTVMVSKIEETLMFHRDSEVSLSANQYPGTIHPNGYEFLKSFERRPIPTFTYHVNGCKLNKKVFMPHGSNTTIVEYENSGKCSFGLCLTPFFMHRDYHSLFSENPFFNYYTDFKTENIGVIYSHYGAPALHFSFSKGEFKENRNWYKNFEYTKEKYRGLDFQEDAFSIGTIEANISPGERIYIAFSLDEETVKKDSEKLKAEEIKRINSITVGDDFLSDLTIAADQFIVHRKSSGGKTIIAGYHWFTDWGRDTMIAMRGLVIALGKKELAESILKTFLKYLDGGMLPNRFPDQGEEPEYNTIDATLWLFIVLHEYYEKFNNLEFIEEIFLQLTEIIEAHINGTRYNIHMLEEGLLFGGKGLSQLTWMDARVGDFTVTPRHGCPVEINALWYNALMIYNHFFELIQNVDSPFKKLVQKVKANFRKYFINENNYLNDVIIPNEYLDDSFRPNQIYALSLPYPLLEKKEGKQLMELIEEKLFTPYGLRSLDPNHFDYKGKYGGDQWHRDTAYHQGTVWTFLLGEYFLAHLQINGFTKKAKSEILKMTKPINHHFYEEGCIHGISEIFDGDAPSEGRGCVQQAWSVGMLLKVLIDAYAKKPTKTINRKALATI
ncbi:MAG: amylo-alpha-1,6-glucosidase [Saprospiraceae bacterium]